MPMCPHCPSGDDVDSIAVPVTRPDVPLAGPISDAPEGDAGPGGLAAGPPEDLPIGPLPPGPFPPLPSWRVTSTYATGAGPFPSTSAGGTWSERSGSTVARATSS